MEERTKPSFKSITRYADIKIKARRDKIRDDRLKEECDMSDEEESRDKGFSTKLCKNK